MDVERAGGPSYKTVQAIEAGDIGTVDSLDKCATALGLSLVDVLSSVLTAQLTPLSPEAAQVVRKFAETTVEGRHALVAIAKALPASGERLADAAGAPATAHPPRSALPDVMPRKRR